MDELDDLDSYNDDPAHDMWVDFTTHQYTGELGELFDDDDDTYDGFDDETEDYFDDEAEEIAE